MAFDALARLVGASTSFVILTKVAGVTVPFALTDIIGFSSNRFRFDGTSEETIDRIYTPLTNSQIESRSAVTIPPMDHVVREPIVLSATGILTPGIALGPLGGVSALVSSIQNVTGQRRDLQLYEVIKSIADKRQLTTVIMAEESVDNMLITRLGRVKGPEDGEQISIRISMQEQRIALPGGIAPSAPGDVLQGGTSAAAGPQSGSVVSAPRLTTPI